MTSPRFALAASLLLITALPPITAAQYGRGGGGRESGGYREGRDLGPPPPPLPGAEIDGPPDSAAMRSMFALSDSQTVRYAALYDSLLVSTRPQRDSVRAATDRMHTRLDSGDRAAANFYAELLMDLAKELKASQDKFDDRLRGLLSRDQLKAYRRWEDGAERAAQARNREEGLRWSAPMVYGGRSAGGSEDRRSTVRAADAPAPDLGAQAVRVGRTVYVAAQTALDSAGIVQGADLRTQAAQAFKNLTAVLRKSGATPADVVRLTVYVVGYDRLQLPLIREAGTAYFAGKTVPVTAVLGVQSVGQTGLLIAVEATAVTESGSVAVGGRP